MAETPSDSFDVAEVSADQWMALKKKLEGELSGKPLTEAPAAPVRPPVSGQSRLPGTVVETPTAQGLSPEDQAVQDDVATIMGPAQTPGALAKGVGDMVLQGIERAKTPQNMRGILRGVGSAAGGMAGFGVPAPGATMIGTGLGSMAGNYMADVYDSYYNTAKATGEKPAILESTMSHFKDAALDAAVTGGVQVVYPIVTGAAKGLLAKLLRLPPNSSELLKEASDIGVELGVANMPGSRGQGIVNIFGRIPLIGGSAQGAAKLQAKQLVAAQNDMFGQVASPKAMTEVSRDAYEAGTRKFSEFATKIQRQAEHALRVGEEAGQIVPAAKLKKAAEEATTFMESLPGGAKAWLNAKELKMLKAIQEGPDALTTVDIKSIDAFLENTIRRTAQSTNTVSPSLGAVKKAANDALGSVDHPAAKLMLKVQNDFRAGLRTFITDEGKAIGKLDRNIFAIDDVKPGTKTPEQLVEVMNSLKTPQQVQNMRSLTGDDTIKQVMRAKMDTAWHEAVESAEGEAFKWSGDKFRKALGLNDPNSRAFAATQEMLRGTGVTADDLVKLSNVAESVATAPIADVSTFMARAAMLRGAGGIREALIGAATLGLSGGATAKHGLPGLITTLTGMVMARGAVGSLMRPGILKAATVAADETAENAVRVAALTQLFTNYPQDALEDMVDEHITPAMQQGIERVMRPAPKANKRME